LIVDGHIVKAGYSNGTDANGVQDLGSSSVRWRDLYLSGEVKGNAQTATKWATARTLSLSGDASGSVSWDGSANATLSVAVANDSHTHDGRYYTESEADSRFLRGNADDSFSGNLTSADNGWIKFYASEEMDSNDGKIGSGVFATGLNIVGAQTSAGTGRQVRIWGDLITSGGESYFSDNYHPNADKWTTARTLSLSGDASGSVSWDGSGNATLSVAVNDDSHNHTIANVDGLQTALNGKLSTSGKAADSNLLDGLDLHTGRNNQANRVVRTQGNGYAEFGWINTTSGDTSAGLSRIYVDTGDGYIRKSTLAHVASQLPIDAGAKNDIFWENGQNVTSNYTITNGKNAMSAGPITINSGVTVTVGAGETWTVI